MYDDAVWVAMATTAQHTLLVANTRSPIIVKETGPTHIVLESATTATEQAWDYRVK